MSEKRCDSLFAAVLITVLASPTIAAPPPGKGGGKNGDGDDEPVQLPDVRYLVTPISIPGTGYYFNASNNDGARVGWFLGGGNNGIRALAYLPDRSANGALDLNGPELGVQGIWDGWHLRSAIGINNHGDIVGNMAPNDTTDPRRVPFYLDTNVDPPQLTVLGPFDLGSVDEHACDINDSGDIVVWSTGTGSVHVGNPGLYGNAVDEFQTIDFTALTGESRVYGSTEIPLLSNRLGPFPAVLAGKLDNASPDQVFRMSADSGWFEFASDYQNSSGDAFEFRYPRDLNDLGDLAGTGVVSRAGKKKRTSSQYFASLWLLGSQQYDAVASASANESPWYSAVINNHGDAVVNDASASSYAIHHADSSQTFGAMDVAALIHPDDPNRDLFGWVDEITDRVPIADPFSENANDFWPEILGGGHIIVDGVEVEIMFTLTPVAYPTSN